MAEQLPFFRGGVILSTGLDPDDMYPDAWLAMFYAWCREQVHAGADHKKKGDGEAKWRQFERAVWEDVERPEQSRRQAFASAQSALQQLGAMHG
ncbi:MAG: hypothetical protein ACRDQD_08205 [Nocardioidaceae bacterium]